MPDIVVIGSINIDLVANCDHFPQVGESIFGTDFNTFCGGKGANQAVCAAKLGAHVTMVGCVGNDANGRTALANFDRWKVDCRYITSVNEPTGVALIIVADNDNEIVVIKGANALVSRQTIDQAIEVIRQADMVVLQLEVPLDTVTYAIMICERYGVPVILNPAPYQPFDPQLIEKVTYLTPNRIETSRIFGDDHEQALKRYPNKLIMTSGKDGVYYHDGHQVRNCPARPVKVVDTTGAGDTFSGALAVALAGGKPLEGAIDFAQRAAGIAIGKLGAQTAMPLEDEM